MKPKRDRARREDEEKDQVWIEERGARSDLEDAKHEVRALSAERGPQRGVEARRTDRAAHAVVAQLSEERGLVARQPARPAAAEPELRLRRTSGKGKGCVREGEAKAV